MIEDAVSIETASFLRLSEHKEDSPTNPPMSKRILNTKSYFASQYLTAWIYTVQ